MENILYNISGSNQESVINILPFVNQISGAAEVRGMSKDICIFSDYSFNATGVAISVLVAAPIYKTFEECYDRIEAVVEKKRSSWMFKATNMEDFDDVKMQILQHIFIKWHLFDQNRNVESWAAGITKNLFINKLRDCYAGTASPCNRCACNMGNNLCSEYGEQGEECAIFGRWYHGKRHKHEARMPLTMENRLNEVGNTPALVGNLEQAVEEMHHKMQKRLTAAEWEVYDLLYIQHKTEEEAAKILGLLIQDKIKNNRIRIVKKIILRNAKDILLEEGIHKSL